jgi:hypothetical protein
MNKNLLRLLDSHSPPKPALRNQYKRQDVFRCMHDSHDRFNNAVSVYHVLKVKKCFPDGCTFFRWKCRNLNKGIPCHKKFQHVGRLCFSCRHFYDIKEVNRPEFLPGENELQRFKDELEYFENWLDSLQGKQVELSGKITSVKPEFILKKGNKRDQVLLDGFILTINDCFINSTHYQDLVYAPISIGAQSRLHYARDDSIDCRGYFTVSNGMIIIRSIKGVEITESKAPEFWTESRARVVQKTGAVLPRQCPACYSCDRSSLLRVISDAMPAARPRALFCFEGVTDPDLCGYRAGRLLTFACPHDEFDVIV